MDINLNGKNVLVTGATRGIGAAVSLALASAGANVVGCFRGDEEAAERTRRALKESGGEHHIVKADVTNAAAVEAMIAEARNRYGELHGVVNNAAAISHVPFEELSTDEWHRVIDGGLTSVYLVTQKALALLGEGSSVVNIGSRVAVVGVPLRSHYAAAKAGLTGLTRSLCKEFSKRRIRVNLASLGVVLTEEAAKVPAERLKRYETMIALGRLARPEEVANAVLFLLSDLSSYVNGATLEIDGGM